mmetsp:Transcript_16516/g.24716  ORF Transcript_16516/g.24716 Transcript_16516/m.24716 type:complete len:89 (-) Transcript_16516:306-572(-)
MKGIQSLLTHANAHAHQTQILTASKSVVKRYMAFTPSPLFASGSQAFHALGLVVALGGITGIISLAPLDEFEKIEKKNVAYHHHLHPR